MELQVIPVQPYGWLIERIEGLAVFHAVQKSGGLGGWFDNLPEALAAAKVYWASETKRYKRDCPGRRWADVAVRKLQAHPVAPAAQEAP